MNIKSKDGRTPLHIVVDETNKYEEKTVDLMTALMLFGADVNIKNDGGETPADVLTKKGHPELAVIVRLYGATGGIDPDL